MPTKRKPKYEDCIITKGQSAPRVQSVNARTAEMPHDRRKSYVLRDLHLQPCELSSVSRSATLANDPLQEGGRKKGRGKAKDKRRDAGEAARPVESADNLARELDLALGGQSPLPASICAAFRRQASGQ